MKPMTVEQTSLGKKFQFDANANDVSLTIASPISSVKVSAVPSWPLGTRTCTGVCYATPVSRTDSVTLSLSGSRRIPKCCAEDGGLAEAVADGS